MTLKNGVFTKTDGYQKPCDTNKNVLKMGMTVEVYYSVNHNQPIQE